MYQSKKYFFISLVGHLFLFMLFFGFSFLTIPFESQIYTPEVKETVPFIPAYMYRAPAKRLVQTKPQKSVETSKWGIEKPQASKTETVAQSSHSEAQSQATLPQQQKIKSKKTFDDPLLSLLHNATAAKLVYPRTAADFNQNGIVDVGFVIAPSGQVTQVKLMKSSGFELLDNAALTAIKAISPVFHVDRYLQQPKFVTAHISFLNNNAREFAIESHGD